MAISVKTLGQVATSATTETTLYTVPASTTTIVSSLYVCNRGSSATTFRVSIAVGGGATANKDYLYYDVAIAGNDTFVATVGVTLTATDIIRVYAGNASLSFSAFGQEQT
jgi:glucose-6-phosphate dehydrogenase assembly protein OpcA